MKRKQLEDWFVEVAAFLVLRAICAITGFGLTLLIGRRIFMRFTYLAAGATITKSYDRAFYTWLAVAAVVAVVFAVIGPMVLYAITGRSDGN